MSRGIIITVSFLSFAALRAAPATERPSVVLVHGAFEDATAWQHVVSILQRDEYDVTAVQAPLTSLGDDVDATKRVLEAQRRPVVLAGHSYGGAVITAAAVGDRHVKALVYVAAFAPDTNEVVAAYIEKYPSLLGSAIKVDSAGFVSVDPVQFPELLASDIPVPDARVAAATQKPILASAFGDSVRRAAWRSIPSWYLLTLNDRAIHPALQRFYAERMKARTIEIRSSHLVIVSHAADVARIIEQAAQS